MKKLSSLVLITSLFVSAFAVANEVNVFNGRHYKSDAELYSMFTNKTGIKVNLINGKSGALEKRMIEEGRKGQTQGRFFSRKNSNSNQNILVQSHP